MQFIIQSIQRQDHRRVALIATLLTPEQLREELIYNRPIEGELTIVHHIKRTTNLIIKVQYTPVFDVETNGMGWLNQEGVF